MWAGAQAVLAYRVPLAGSLDRPQRKILHAALHSAALLCIVLALVAAFQSHNLKRPHAHAQPVLPALLPRPGRHHPGLPAGAQQRPCT